MADENKNKVNDFVGIDQTMIKDVISWYNGEDITCYPGSNQTDDGKLNLEFNMARFVTRVSSKNFCIIKPSFDIEIYDNPFDNSKQLRVLPGQASINGMDLIATNSITINPPKEPGHYHLAFHLGRDSSDNVLGDRVVGSSRTFYGLYLAYITDKPDPVTDPDIFYLGSFDWDGENFSNIVEDEDKYGRIWAEDILCKIRDPKHPDYSRLNLQEWLDKVPDWFFSKEGDTVYGPIIVSDNRDNNNPGIIMNVDETGSHITVKDPTQDNEKLQFYGDLNRDGVIDEKDAKLVEDYINGKITLDDLQLKLADVNHDGVVDEKDLKYILNFINYPDEIIKPKGDTGNIYYIDASDKGLSIDSGNGRTEIGIEEGKIYQDQVDGILHVHNDKDICIDSESSIKIEADKEILIGTEKDDSPKLKLTDNNATIESSKAPNLKFDISFPNETTIQQILGKAIWQYDEITKIVSLLDNTDTSYLQVGPNGQFDKSIRVNTAIYLGNEDRYGNEQTYLKSNEWQLSDKSNYIKAVPTQLDIVSDKLGTSKIQIKDKSDNGHTILNDNGIIDLYNKSTAVQIGFKDSNSSFDIAIKKVIGSKKLEITGDLDAVNITGTGLVKGNRLQTTGGTLTFGNGTNEATIKKDDTGTALRTSNDLYVGASGTASLFAGATTIKGKTTIGSSGQMTIDTSGNINTSGTITGSKVYNAVYNDYAEIFRKPKDEIIEPGDLVCVREDGLIHKVESEEDIDSIIGICSDTAGFFLGGDGIPEEEQVTVGLVGQIWTKTNTKDLKPGDMLKALPNGTVTYADFRAHKIAIALSKVIDGKVKVLYN